MMYNPSTYTLLKTQMNIKCLDPIYFFLETLYFILICDFRLYTLVLRDHFWIYVQVHFWHCWKTVYVAEDQTKSILYTENFYILYLSSP